MKDAEFLGDFRWSREVRARIGVGFAVTFRFAVYGFRGLGFRAGFRVWVFRV